MNLTNFHIVVYEDLEVVNLSSSGATMEKKVLYFIKCTFLNSSFSGQNNYYTNTLFDENLNRVEDNTIKYYGIDCIIREKEFWGTVKGSWNSVILRATIKDKEGNIKEVNFSNSNHNGEAHKKLFAFLKDLNNYNTYSRLEEALKTTTL